MKAEGKGTKKGAAGFTLAELMVSAGVGTLLLLGIAVIFMGSTLTFADMCNYINMDRSSRNSLDHMTRNIRESNDLISFDPATLVLDYDGAGTTLTYRWDSNAGTLTEEWSTGLVSTLLTGCSSLAFSMYDRGFTNTTDISPGQGKVISVAWRCGQTVLGTRTTTEDMQQAMIVMRKRQ
jgi:hypothetical protein